MFDNFTLKCYTAELPGQYMQIKGTGIRIVGIFAEVGAFELQRSLSAAVDGAAVTLHLLAHGCETVKGAFVEFAASGGTDVQQQVSAFAYRIDKHYKQLLGRFPGFLVAVITP